MGGETSKTARDTSCHDFQALLEQTPPVPWTHIGSIVWQKWKGDIAELWGFDHQTEWGGKNLKVHKRPWSSFCVIGKNRAGKDQKLCSFSSEVFETGREEKIGAWIKDLSVIEFHPQIIVVQAILSKSVKLLVVDWHTTHLLGTYSFAYTKEPCLQECFLSPDASVMLCRQNFPLRRKYNHICSFDANIRVIQIKDGLCKRLFVIEDNLVHDTLGSGISFDPRYLEGRVFIVSSTLQSGESHHDGIQVYDIPGRQLVQSSEGQAQRLVHHARHSPDGKLCAVACVNTSAYISFTIRLHSIQLYNSDTMELMHVISMPNEPCKLSNIGLFPMFSRNSELLAQITGDKSPHVQIYQLPVTFETLQERCRHVILRCTASENMHKLPLPRKLLDFLRFVGIS